MAFFDKKQEVMDVELTQFGKDLLARGFFRPVYYEFFDDDILYNSKFAGFKEHQNSSEDRILKQTPRLKTQYLTYSVEERYILEDRMIVSGDRNRFESIKKTVMPHIQEKILLYPMANQEVQSQESPSYNLKNIGADIKSVLYSPITGSGVQRFEPIINMDIKYKLKEDRSNIVPNTRTNINNETFIDLLSEEIQFSDNSKLTVERDDLIIDLQELNCFTGLDNFFLNIYEVVESESQDEEDTYIKLDTLEKVEKYFKIKKDSEIEDPTHKSLQESNYYKRGEL